MRALGRTGPWSNRPRNRLHPPAPALSGRCNVVGVFSCLFLCLLLSRKHFQWICDFTLFSDRRATAWTTTFVEPCSIQTKKKNCCLADRRSDPLRTYPSSCQQKKGNTITLKNFQMPGLPLGTPDLLIDQLLLCSFVVSLFCFTPDAMCFTVRQFSNRVDKSGSTLIWMRCWSIRIEVCGE